MNIVIAAASALLLAGAPAVTSESPSAVSPPPEPGNVAEIPFNPPLDRPLRYTYTKHETGGSRDGGAKVMMTVQFRRNGDYYVMTVTTTLPPGIPSSHPLAAALSSPVPVRLSRVGEIIAIEDEPALWASIEQAMETIYAGLGDTPGAAEAARRAIQSIRDLPEADRVGFLTSNFAPLVEFAGTPMKAGEPVEREVEGQAPLLGSVTQKVTITVQNSDADFVDIVAVTNVSPEQLNAARSLSERLGVKGRSGGRVISTEKRDRYIVSLKTGLTKGYDSTKVGEIEDENGMRKRMVTTVSLVSAD